MNNDLISEIMGVEVPEFHEACDDETSQDTTSITPDGGGLKEHRYGLTLATFSFVTLNGTDLQQPLPYGRANSVRVDNFGTEWVQIANEVFVPPQWIGYVVQL
ncbi:MAG: hypothetical protein ACRDUW_06495, partial [Pseudonocardiaceae bacterium]